MISVSNHIFTGSFQAHPDDHFVKLLGLHWGQFPEQWEIKSKKPTAVRQALEQVDSRYIEGMSGMTLAIPAWAIKEFLDMPKFRAPRDKRIGELSEWAAENRGPVVESASDDGAKPDHLEDFMRLVSVAARKRPQGDQT